MNTCNDNLRYIVSVKRDSKPVQSLPFHLKENAYFVFHRLQEVAVQQAEEIVELTIMEDSQILKSIHY